MNRHFDVLVVGAGPAGIAAAVRAAEAGGCVALVDDNPACGGQIWRSGAKPPAAAREWLARLDASSVERLQGWHVFGRGESGALLAESAASADGAGRCEIRYEKLILATGARERFLPFPGWTLPNVMGAGGLDAMARGGLPVEGKRIVIAGTGPLLLAVAAHLAGRGAKIGAVCEQAGLRRLATFGLGLVPLPGKLAQGVELRSAIRGAKFYTGCWPVAAKGSSKLEAVTLEKNGKRWDVPCDFLGCGFHLVPNLELPMLLGCGIRDGFVAVNDWQQTSLDGVFCAGEPTGIGGADLAILEGQIAGLTATGRMNDARAYFPARRKGRRFTRALHRAFALDSRLRALANDDTIICRCEDVSYGALRGHVSVRDGKLHTRCGMGPCQGRVCGAATEFLFGWTPDSVRPPILPALVSSLAQEAAATGINGISPEHRKDTP